MAARFVSRIASFPQTSAQEQLLDQHNIGHRGAVREMLPVLVGDSSGLGNLRGSLLITVKDGQRCWRPSVHVTENVVDAPAATRESSGSPAGGRGSGMLSVSAAWELSAVADAAGLGGGPPLSRVNGGRKLTPFEGRVRHGVFTRRRHLDHGRPVTTDRQRSWRITDSIMKRVCFSRDGK
jgi:hypothetical protein